MTLDQLFGPAVLPQGIAGRPAVAPWEAAHSPRSLNRLTSSSASMLRELLLAISSSFDFGRTWINDTIIIWLVDQEGTIWFAVEELVLDGASAEVAKHQTVQLTRRAAKLGHPSLVGGESARIGGEIYFDDSLASPTWIINNRSGRYGLHPTRTRLQLENVADVFVGHKIILVVDFI